MKKRINQLIKNLTIKQKAGQMSQTSACYLKEDTLASNTGVVGDLKITRNEIGNVGSVLNFCGSNEVNELADICKNLSSAKIPPVFMQDVIHGYKTIYPIPLAMGCSFNPDLLEKCAEMAGREAVSGGVHVTFSPMVDLVRDARWGRVMESFGEDPYLNGVMGRANIRGYSKAGLLSCVKHFAAYGAAEAGRDYNTTDMSDYTLYNYYLPPYLECLKENPAMVMTSFNSLNGLPVNANKELLVDVLRKKYGFDGVVISDYNGVIEMIPHGVAVDEKQCAQIAVNNGIDIEMVSTTYLRFLPELVAEKKVSLKSVNKSVKRILALKEQIGLLTGNKKVSAEEEEKVCLSDENISLARQAAGECITLLKNENILPLKCVNKIGVFGTNADDNNVLGFWSCHGENKNAISVRKALKLRNVIIDESAEVSICCIGEKPEMSGEAASKADISISENDVNLLKKLKGLGKRVVSVVFAGRPCVLTEVEKYSDAILYAWFLGLQSGNAIADILFGDVNPSAKLAMSFPRTVGQCPIYYNHYNTGRPKLNDDKFVLRDYKSSYQDVLNSPLYPFGFGLSYTTFSFSDMRLSADRIMKNGSVLVSVKVKNVGEFDGKEVVQLYIGCSVGKKVRPVKELKKFTKIFLAKGEEKIVEFELAEMELRHYIDKDNYLSELGEYEILVGNSSQNLLMKKVKRV